MPEVGAPPEAPSPGPPGGPPLTGLRNPAALTWFGFSLALVLVARTAGWGSHSLWLDEAIQVDFALRDLRGLLEAVVRDAVHPPLDYLVTFLAIRVSREEAFLRSLPVLWSLLTAVALWVRFGADRWRAAAGAVVALAVLPAAVRYGQELRPYALALFLATAADAARHLNAQRPTRGRLAAWALFSTLALYTLYLAALVLAAMFLCEVLVAFRERASNPRRLRLALAVPIVVALAFAPWGLVVAKAVRKPPEVEPTLVTPHVVRTFALGLATSDQESEERPVAAGAVWTLVALGVFRARGEERLRLLAELLATFPLALALLHAIGHWWSLRYVVLAVLPLSRALGYAIAWVAEAYPTSRWLALAVPCAGLVTIQGPGVAEVLRSSWPDWREPCRFLVTEAAKGRAGPVVPADEWSAYCLRGQTLRGRASGLRVEPPLDDVVKLERAMEAHGVGWVVRMPKRRVAASLDTYLARVAPAASFPRADGAALYRFEGGRLVARESVAAGTAETTNLTHGATSTFSCLVPVVVHGGGSASSDWRSDLTLYNPTSAAVRVDLRLGTAGSRIQTRLVGPGSQELLDDVAARLASGAGSWPLEVSSTSPIHASVRTYSAGEGGSFGATVPCVPTAQLLATGDAATLPSLREDRLFRTNIGLANTGARDAVVEVTLWAGRAAAGTYEVAVEAGTWSQSVQPFKRFGAESLAREGRATVRVLRGDGVYPLASVIDNASNDPTFVLPVR